MFEELADRLDGVLSRFKQRGVLTEPMIRDGLREIRRVLLEADVNYKLTREFVERVQERALGETALKSVSPGQQVVKIVHDELVVLLGEEPGGLKPASVGPTIVLLVGLQGSGKTTTAAKLARRLEREGRKPLLVALDVYRPAAVDQLEQLGRQISVPVFADREARDMAELARESVRAAESDRHRAVVLDTAGRLQIDDAMMDELRRVQEAVKPTETLLVVDGMVGQESVRIAEGFRAAVPLSGVILTKMDGDARGGAALSIRGVTGVPIRFLGVGERPDGLEVFDAARVADRILQMGDVVGLVEKAQQAFDADQTQHLERKLAKEGKFDLEDFLVMMRQLQKLGPLEGLLKMVPGVNHKLLKQTKLDPRRLKHIEAIILSMTPLERRKPQVLNGSRRARIARGSGRPVQEVNRLMKQFADMQKLMRQMRKLGLGGRAAGLPKLS
jgi:signal recognition particle subunit SRP54